MTKSILSSAAMCFVVGGVSALAAPIFVVTAGEQRIQTFDSASPGVLTNNQLITGLAAGDVISAIDLRPSDNTVYGLTSNSRLYALNPGTGQASFLTGVGIGASGGTGFDFNPIADAGGLPSLRASGGLLTGTQAQNVRIDVATGQTFNDSPFAFAAGDPNAGVTPIVPALAYATFEGAPTLYGLVSRPGASINPPILVIVPNPTAGTMSTVGSLGILNLNSIQGLDISAGGDAYAAIASQLYTIDLDTGQAALVGGIGTGAPVVGLAVGFDDPGPGPSPVPEPGTTLLLGTSLAALFVIRRRA
jgi:hypothetical protein